MNSPPMRTGADFSPRRREEGSPGDRIDGSPRRRSPSPPRRRNDQNDRMEDGLQRHPRDMNSPDRQAPSAPRSSKSCIYLGNLPFHLSTVEIERIASRFGPILRINHPFDIAYGRPRGFAFIEFERRVDAEEAFAYFKEKQFEGRWLKVDWDEGLGSKQRRGPMDRAMPPRSYYPRSDYGAIRQPPYYPHQAPTPSYYYPPRNEVPSSYGQPPYYRGGPTNPPPY